MQALTTIGLDIAKSVFHVHGVDAQKGCRSSTVEAPVHLAFFKKLSSCLVGMGMLGLRNGKPLTGGGKRGFASLDIGGTSLRRSLSRLPFQVSHCRRKPLKTYESLFWLTFSQALDTEQIAKRPTGRQKYPLTY